MKRKLIGCIICRPENTYQSRILDGLMSRCELYGYNLAVFSPLVDVTHYHSEYLKSEMNILQLVNYDMLDALIVVTEPFVTDGNNDGYLNDILKDIDEKCSCPVIALDLPISDKYETVEVDDITAFERITAHVLDTHGCRKVYFLKGYPDHGISVKRFTGFKNEMERHSLPIDESNVFPGDFWYTSGEQLADKIISGEVDMPEAVICASDFMAMGLVNRLDRSGIKVPEQVIVTGFDASQEAVINDISITSYTPEVKHMAEKAINRIRELIEPDAEVIPLHDIGHDGLYIGATCGCEEDIKHQKRLLADALYRVNRNFFDTEVKNNTDIGHLHESYMLEDLTQSQTPLECLKRLCSQVYLLRPYGHFYLCLRENWLDTEVQQTVGYPDTMRCVIHTINDTACDYGRYEEHCRNDDRDVFETKLMLPELLDERDVPCVFYFTPCHFQSDTLGYGVLQCELKDSIKPTLVYRSWMRNVNNALEMSRVQNSMISNALIDMMTKLYNRRGMDIRIGDMMHIAEPGHKFLAMVIDMDGLKSINDTYGHNEGDYGITTISSVVRCITEGGEIAVRAGGDEFYILGMSHDYSDETIQKRITRFYEILSEQNKISLKPYQVTASIGYCIKGIDEVHGINEVISVADANMYTSKVERKANRKK